MEWAWEIRPIRFFSFYLILMFAIGTWLRLGQYRIIFDLARGMQTRWPKLWELVQTHRALFFTWGTLLPLGLVATLWATNSVAVNFVWPQASNYTVASIWSHWWSLVPVTAATAAMLSYDVYVVRRVGNIDQEALGKHFDLAESWLTGWKPKAVSWLTLGFVKTTDIVSKEVRGHLVSATQLLNQSLWQVTIQTGLRILCGLTLWGTYAVQAHA